MRHIKLLALFLSSLILLAACSSTPFKAPEVTPTREPAKVQTAPEVTPAPQPTAAINPLDDPNSPLPKRSIYFAFDKYSIDNSYTATLQAHAQYLVNHPEQHIKIQGNTDDRGSAEYNLALGQKRAETVLKTLNLLGVPDGQMEAISFGKEKPKAKTEGQSQEAWWAENRRADIVYQR